MVGCTTRQGVVGVGGGVPVPVALTENGLLGYVDYELPQVLVGIAPEHLHHAETPFAVKEVARGGIHATAQGELFAVLNVAHFSYRNAVGFEGGLHHWKGQRYRPGHKHLARQGVGSGLGLQFAQDVGIGIRVYGVASPGLLRLLCPLLRLRSKPCAKQVGQHRLCLFRQHGLPIDQLRHRVHAGKRIVRQETHAGDVGGAEVNVLAQPVLLPERECKCLVGVGKLLGVGTRGVEAKQQLDPVAARRAKQQRHTVVGLQARSQCNHG